MNILLRKKSSYKTEKRELDPGETLVETYIQEKTESKRTRFLHARDRESSGER